MKPAGSPLRTLSARAIDIVAAREHFDLPVEDQFASRKDLVSALEGVRRELADLFDGMEAVPVWRGLLAQAGDLPDDMEGHDFGSCWSWSREGALKGSGLSEQSGGLLLEGAVHVDEVDWATTVAVNAFHEDEAEIVVPDGSAVAVSRIVSWPSEEVLFDRGRETDGPSGP